MESVKDKLCRVQEMLVRMSEARANGNELGVRLGYSKLVDYLAQNGSCMEFRGQIYPYEECAEAFLASCNSPFEESRRIFLDHARDKLERICSGLANGFSPSGTSQGKTQPKRNSE
jgi:hypothetical protein